MIVVYGKTPRQSKTSKKFKRQGLDFFAYSSKSSTSGTVELYCYHKELKDYVLLSTFFFQEQCELFIDTHSQRIKREMYYLDISKVITRENFFKKDKNES